MMVTPWESANIPGPEMAKMLNSKMVLNLIKQAKRPLMIVGARSPNINLEEKNIVDYAIQFGRKGIQLATTAHIFQDFLKKGYKPNVHMPLSNITDRLKDPDWKGIDNKGAPDLVIFFGIHYYFQSQMLSTLKHFAPRLKKISLDREFQPNADFSFPNLGSKKWKDELEKIIEEL